MKSSHSSLSPAQSGFFVFNAGRFKRRISNTANRYSESDSPMAKRFRSLFYSLILWRVGRLYQKPLTHRQKMKNKTQEKRIIDRLLQFGYITRNECLKNYISRLGAIICDLKKEGWDFEGKFIKKNGGQDFVYTVTKCPFKKVERFIPSLGKSIISYEK